MKAKLVKETLNESTHPGSNSYYEIVGDEVLSMIDSNDISTEAELIKLISAVLKSKFPDMVKFLMNDDDFVADTLSYISEYKARKEDSDRAFKQRWGGKGPYMPF